MGNMQIKIAGHLQKHVPLLCGILINAIILALMHRDYPNVGHDYRYFILRIIDTKLHLLINGPSIQWYTPSFGGGLPAYPNPQHIEYSIIQLFSLFLNPWVATLLSTFAIGLIGFMFFEQFLAKIMNFHWASSTLGAVFFIGNGFFIEHMIVGHIGHQLFPLGAIIMYAALDNRFAWLKGGAVIALIVAMMIHQTGFYVIVILGLSFLITIPLVRLYNSKIFSPELAIRKLAFGLILAGLMASSKIYAVLSLMHFFPRIASDTYPIGLLQALIGLVAQLLGVMFFIPFLLLARQDTSLLSGSLSNITGAHFGIWETDIGLSPVLIILLFFSLARLMGIARKGQTEKINSTSQSITWMILFIGIWVTAEMTLARGLIYSYIKDLPILQSMHVNVRFAAGFILPLVLVGVMEYEIVSRARHRQAIFMIAAGLSFLFVFSYNFLSADVHSRHYDLIRTLQTDAAINRGERFPISQVANIEEEAVFLEHATNILRYEPLFSDYDRIPGYKLKDISIQVRPGAVTDQDGIYFNMTNPASLVFPQENHLKLFERIKVSEEDELHAFVERRQPAWKIPHIQAILNWVSLTTLVITIGLIFFPFRTRRFDTFAI